ncbi:MAG TPA: hypothetical protein VGF94_04290 [Kofleriaceae bacterium]|jgi:hypothetical protein
MRAALVLVALVALVALAACGRSGGATADAGGDASAGDGTPTRVPCTSQFGNALPATPTYGRLDGYLVAVVAPSNMNSCNDDDSHVHLQIRMNDEIYDVAIDATDAQTGMDDVHTTTLELALPAGGPWSEGWHQGFGVDYTSLGVSPTDLPLDTKAQIVNALMTDLATVNHISVFATTYGGSGIHLVHREGNAHDGLVVTDPLSPVAHLRLFSFTGQTFLELRPGRPAEAKIPGRAARR